MKEILSNMRQKPVESFYREVLGDAIYYVVTYKDSTFESVELDEILLWLY